jgi:RNA polymerase sigma factor (TIGR02999 family)
MMGEDIEERGEVTRLLLRIRAGDQRATEDLIPIVYTELRRMAAAAMHRERPGHTLQPTAVVHEAYLRMIGNGNLNLENRAHFFAVASRCMRRVLVDYARRRIAGKRGGEHQQEIEVELNNIGLTFHQSEDVLALHSALEELEKLDEQQARIVEMAYFSGNSIPDIATVLGISGRTVNRELKTARLFLKRQLRSDQQNRQG